MQKRLIILGNKIKVSELSMHKKYKALLNQFDVDSIIQRAETFPYLPWALQMYYAEIDRIDRGILFPCGA
jgi:hypothetical protein